VVLQSEQKYYALITVNANPGVSGVVPPSGIRHRQRGSFAATLGTMKQVRDPLPFPLVSGSWFDKVMAEIEVETNLSQMGAQSRTQATDVSCCLVARLVWEVFSIIEGHD
jgi:hypothetical protein